MNLSKKQTNSKPNFLTKVITNDKSWCYRYVSKTKKGSSQEKTPSSPRPKKARLVRSNIKSMIIVFFDVRRIEPQEFVSPGQIINQHFYLEICGKMC
ncbi:HTH_48 domain-containing protein [Nephila pilipes]|uniref:HTH_48 domain-containing protein n=1 Tax=Nephila pilipes TaxID=299642 RepID=A0A8X6QNZ5_NEPPI|nr:HTH_48 domain-containing protein [Nephila pilipes]